MITPVSPRDFPFDILKNQRKLVHVGFFLEQNVDYNITNFFI